ncbi:MAG TPA: hypothetical protein VF148_10730 [Acidimicrobiia bacterium]
MGLRKLFVIGLGIALLLAPAVAGAVIGFNGPLFGLSTAPNGDLLVADASTGIFSIDDGMLEAPTSIPGATDVNAIGRNSLWVTTGAGEDPAADTGQASHLGRDATFDRQSLRVRGDRES